MKNTRSSFALASLLIFPSLTFAADNFSTEIDAQIGYLLIEGDSNLDNALVYGARFGNYINENVSIELSLLGGESDIEATDRDADLLLPTAEAQYHFGEYQVKKFRPYLAGGAGFLQSNRDRLVDQNHI